MGPKDADWMPNSVDHDQTALLGAVWSEQSDLGITLAS